MSCFSSPGAHVLATAYLMICLTGCDAQKVSWQLGADILPRALTSPSPAAVARSTRPARAPAVRNSVRKCRYFVQTAASRRTKCGTSTPLNDYFLFLFFGLSKFSSLQWIRRTRGASLRASDSFDLKCNNSFGHVTQRENPALCLQRGSSKLSHFTAEVWGKLSVW